MPEGKGNKDDNIILQTYILTTAILKVFFFRFQVPSDVRLEAQGLVQRERQVRLVEQVRADMREMEVRSVGGQGALLSQSVLGFTPTESRKYLLSLKEKLLAQNKDKAAQTQPMHVVLPSRVALPTTTNSNNPLSSPPPLFFTGWACLLLQPMLFQLGPLSHVSSTRTTSLITSLLLGILRTC